MRLEKTWIIKEADPSAVVELARALRVSQPVARYLAARGYLTPEAALSFINLNLDCLENPFRLPDMAAAVERLQLARKRGEKVFIAGDRDVDGVTSTAVLSELLSLAKIPFGWKTPEAGDGYGLSLNAVTAAVEAKASLLITVDCGIRDFDGIAAAREQGLDVVVLDHHEPAETLPPARAVVDPKREDSAYSFPDLAGCGVVFKFCQAFLMAEDESFFNRDLVFFDLETSGSSAASGGIVEIGAIRTRNGVETGRFHTMARPDGPVPAFYTGIHGITEEMLVGAPTEREAIEKFLEFAGASVLVAHNASFDVKFLKTRAEELCGIKVANEKIDSLKLARQVLPAADRSLAGVAAQFGIPAAEKHRAMADAETLFAVYRRLLSRANQTMQDFLKAQLDLVALATVADVVPLVGENRALVRLGLGAFLRSVRPGVVAIRAAFLREGDRLTAKDLAWSVAPVLNAAGRLGESPLAAELLMTADAERARQIVSKLAAMNVERKELTAANMEIVEKELDKVFDPENDAAVVLAIEEMDHGVTGVLANRVLENVGRPVVILIADAEKATYRGTARASGDFDLSAAFTRLEHLLVKHGGHRGACGVTVKAENVPLFKTALSALIRKEVAPEKLQPRLEIDAEVAPDEISETLLKELDQLEPTGHGNAAPLFCLRGAEVTEVRRMGDADQHVKLLLRAVGATRLLEMVAWNAGEKFATAVGDRIDVAFGVERNEWRGRVGLQCVLADLKRARGRENEKR